MSVRKIITIDEEKCTGCGLCLPNCPEGALQIIDGKVRLVSDLFCDGLGACIGYCPEGAITVVEREAEPYDESRVMANIARQGANTIRAHLDHLRAHGEDRLLAEAVAWLARAGIPVPADPQPAVAQGCCGGKAAGSPAACAGEQSSAAAAPVAAGAAAATVPAGAAAPVPAAAAGKSELANWPVQLHLLSPMAPGFRGKDVLLSADCVAFSMGGFHQSLLAGRSLAIACPKLDDGAEIYREKITALIDHAQISSLTVALMEVPCCRGLLRIVQDARQKAHRSLPVRVLTIAIRDGAVLAEETM